LAASIWTLASFDRGTTPSRSLDSVSPDWASTSNWAGTSCPLDRGAASAPHKWAAPPNWALANPASVNWAGASL